MWKLKTLTRLMLVGLRAAHDQPAAEELLVVQFLYRTLCLLNGLHLHKCKTLRALIVAITDDLCVLHVSHTVEQLKEIAFCRVEREIANVKTGRCDFNPFGFAGGSRRLCAIPRLCRCFLLLAAIPEKFGNPLPKGFFLRFRRFLLSANAFLISSASGPTARAA
jgi:hypothetical protein